jgi:L-threonylcarbamoyladenylate synthase
VARIFAAKGRPADHPVIVHVAATADIAAWAVEVPESAWRLAAAFWPGPLTLILKRAPHVLDAVTGGQATVGLRVPSHPLAHAVLAAFAARRNGRPAGVAAPSANRFGRVSPTTAAHVREEFGATVDMVLDGGQCEVGIESTIVDCTGVALRILRPGRITADQVAAELGEMLSDGTGKAQAPRVSGSLDAHYAPHTRTLLVATADLGAVLAREAGRRVALLSFATPAAPVAAHIQACGDPHDYAHGVYAALRVLDTEDCDVILVEQPPAGGAWDGVNDRLQRAAFGSGA